MPDSIDKILQTKKTETPAGAEKEEDKFFSILLGEGSQEEFFEIQFRNGVRTCFSYAELLLFTFTPDDRCIDLEFGGYLVMLKGRGLCPKLFNGIKNKRVAWVKEADSEMQDHKDNETYIEEILVLPPAGLTEEEPAKTE